MYEPNDGRFPDESDVEIRYPLADEQQTDRASWPWVRGFIAGQCGPDEWDIVVEGAGPCGVDGDGEPLYWSAYRSADEIRQVAADAPLPE